MNDLFGAVARILGFALATAIGCMSVIWAIATFVILTTGVEVPPNVIAGVMAVAGLAGAIGGGCAWAVEVEDLEAE